MNWPSDDLEGPLTRAANCLLSGSALSSASAAHAFIFTQLAAKRLRLRFGIYTTAYSRFDAEDSGSGGTMPRILIEHHLMFIYFINIRHADGGDNKG
jgi:hypothetical protein